MRAHDKLFYSQPGWRTMGQGENCLQAVKHTSILQVTWENREIPTLHFFAFLKTNTATYYVSHMFYDYMGLLVSKSSFLPAIYLYIIVNV